MSRTVVIQLNKMARRKGFKDYKEQEALTKQALTKFRNNPHMLRQLDMWKMSGGKKSGLLDILGQK